MEDKHSKPHAIMVPLPRQGHVIPFTHLAMKLASNGFTITFVNTKIIHHQITKSESNGSEGQEDIFAAARKSGLDVRYRTVSDGFPLAFNRSQNLDQYLEGACLPCTC
ncbi:UDP-glycosyltransferase 86A1-like [Prunus yedoensis var. nudiflora]|uniref:UDP-glycosyltransferase 86A1-like n=1 Tax=Prunus yedoensis var. nudiflora TaxID=2094558 RepID=A0A314ZX80_PRUYE|nr:UDP-glycosyltransferase 86A1-like [Prunus yedoensis var. nudiflora]PQQ07690.1 UDP-glycosyltransferase 86A1-like [Prunus yedoensis var. nudiflora]